MAKKQMIPWKLIISELKQDISPEDKILLEEWLASSDNRNLYKELEEMWKSIKKDAAGYQPDTDYYWKELQSRIKNNKKSVFQNKIKSVVAVAAAVVLIVISGSAMIVSSYISGRSDMQTYTSFNGKSKLVLPDGSTVWLNKGSTIRYSTLFSKHRNLELDGEALFDVTKNPESPFIVHTAGIQIKVYGTQFNVNSYNRDTDVRVALIEGSVSIITDNEEAHLIPGEVATLNKSTHTIDTQHLSKETTSGSSSEKLSSKTISNLPPSTKSLLFESFWASESINFDHKDLGYICSYLEKWYQVDINLDPSLNNTQYYTFTLKDEPLELILRIMSKLNPISYSFTEENTVYITNAKPDKKEMPMK